MTTQKDTIKDIASDIQVNSYPYRWSPASLTFNIYLYPRFEKVGGILVYICPWFRPWFRPSFRPSFRNSVTLFRQRYLHNRLG